MIRRPPRSTPKPSSAASDVYKRQVVDCIPGGGIIVENCRLGRWCHAQIYEGSNRGEKSTALPLFLFLPRRMIQFFLNMICSFGYLDVSACSLPNYLYEAMHYPCRKSNPGSHSRLFSPLPTAVRALHFFSREDFSFFLPRRLASNCAYPCC